MVMKGGWGAAVGRPGAAEEFEALVYRWSQKVQWMTRRPLAACAPMGSGLGEGGGTCDEEAAAWGRITEPCLGALPLPGRSRSVRKRHQLEVGRREVAADAEQRQAGELGDGVGEAVAEVQAGRVMALAVAEKGGPSHEPMILPEGDHGDLEARHDKHKIGGGAERSGGAAPSQHCGRLDERGRTDCPHRGLRQSIENGACRPFGQHQGDAC